MVSLTERFGGRFLDVGGAVYNLRHPAFGAAGDGLTDDCDAFQKANATGGPVLIPKGTYRIGADLVIGVPTTFAPGAVLKPDSGVTVRLSAPIDAGTQRIFLLEAGGSVFLEADSAECVLPQWFGARADGEADDTASIQAALDAVCRTRRRGVVALPRGAGPYVITGTLDVDGSYVSLVSDGAEIDARAIDTGAAILFTGEGPVHYDQNRAAIDGLLLRGSGRRGQAIGIRFEAQEAGANRAARTILRRCHVAEFGTGLYFGDFSFTHAVYDTQVRNCGVCAHAPSGTIDAGERLTFVNTNFFNSDRGLVLGNGNADVYFLGCSLDYIGRRFVDVTRGVANLIGCHVEGKSDVDHWLHATGDGSTIRLTDCTVVVTGEKTQFEFGYADASTAFGGIELHRCHVNWGRNYAVRRMVAGDGRVVVSTLSHPRVGNKPTIAAAANRVNDSAFEGDLSEWEMAGDAPEADRRVARTGSASLKFAVTRPGRSSRARTTFRIAPGQQPRVSFYYRAEGLHRTRAAFYVVLKFIDRAERVISTHEARIAADDDAWTLVGSPFRVVAPPGSDAAVLQLEGRNFDTSTVVHVDDIEFNVL